MTDGVFFVLVAKCLNNNNINKISGFEVHQKLFVDTNSRKGKVFYLGSTNEALKKNQLKIQKIFPNIEVDSYLPSYNFF